MSFFVTFKKSNHDISIGIAIKDKKVIVDLPAALNKLQEEGQLKSMKAIPKHMIDFIQSSADFQDDIVTIMSKVNQDLKTTYIYQESDVTLLAPIPRPTKNVFAIGLNYKKHSEEFTGSESLAEFPIVFTKAPTSVIGPDAEINSYPQYTNSIDYEAELAVVIGKTGKDISIEEAEDFIFGYTIINDISVRDRQKRTSQWFLGKAMDTHCPMGPYLVDKKDIGWPVELEIMSRVNGEERQHSNTKRLLHNIPKIIATISEGLTLEPGDIIATGTCEGVGLGFDPPRFLKPGDIVEVEIEKLGILRNHVV